MQWNRTTQGGLLCPLKTYIKIKELELSSRELRAAGKTRKGTEESLGLEKSQIPNWAKRYNREQAQKSRKLSEKEGTAP